ncbi:MAG TPA: BolA family protein [Permianibacter sp.]|nr:BolA family protein [Permianibacter sp.]
MDNRKRLVEMEARLRAALQPSELQLLDESHLHAGHAGALTGKGHFAVRIVSEQFRDKLPLARHRLVYAALGELMETDIHALRIDAQAP